MIYLHECLYVGTLMHSFCLLQTRTLVSHFPAISFVFFFCHPSVPINMSLAFFLCVICFFRRELDKRIDPLSCLYGKHGATAGVKKQQAVFFFFWGGGHVLDYVLVIGYLL